MPHPSGPASQQQVLRSPAARNLALASVAAYALMVAPIAWLAFRHELFARSIPGLAGQAAAICLMLWARVAFGLRSFHAAATATAGGIVSSGPYRYLRHPIYAAILYFFWVAVLDHPAWPVAGGALLATAGAAVRMFAEERLLLVRYPEYASYSARTARVVPFLL